MGVFLPINHKDKSVAIAVSGKSKTKLGFFSLFNQFPHEGSIIFFCFSTENKFICNIIRSHFTLQLFPDLHQLTSFTMSFLLSIEGNKTNVQTKQNKMKNQSKTIGTEKK